MTDTENKTQDTTEKSSTDTAPYLKKNSNKEPSESSKGNFVIPLILLLVSAIVIIATFYEEEYSSLWTASTETFEDAKNAVSDAGDQVAAVMSEISEAATDENTAEDGDATDTGTPVAAVTDSNAEAETESTSDTAAKDNEATEGTETAATASLAEPVPAIVSAQAAPVKAPSAAEPVQQDQRPDQSQAYQTAAAAAANQKITPYSRAPMPQTDRASYLAAQQQREIEYKKAREAAIQRAKLQAKKYDEMIKQRRQAHEKEMQARRQQYEEDMKAYQEQRAKIAEAQKAIYQRVQQNRAETSQQLKEMHEEIERLHKEFHEMMRQRYQSNAKSSAKLPQAAIAESM
jgi:hypothetical protein